MEDRQGSILKLKSVAKNATGQHPFHFMSCRSVILKSKLETHFAANYYTLITMHMVTNTCTVPVASEEFNDSPLWL